MNATISDLYERSTLLLDRLELRTNAESSPYEFDISELLMLVADLRNTSLLDGIAKQNQNIVKSKYKDSISALQTFRALDSIHVDQDPSRDDANGNISLLELYKRSASILQLYVTRSKGFGELSRFVKLRFSDAFQFLATSSPDFNFPEGWAYMAARTCEDVLAKCPGDPAAIAGLCMMVKHQSLAFGLVDENHLHLLKSIRDISADNADDSLLETIAYASIVRFEIFLEEPDIENAINSIRVNLDSKHFSDPQGGRLLQLAKALRLRYRHREKLEDLVEANILIQKAKQVARGSPLMTAECHYAEGLGLRTQYQFTESANLLTPMVESFQGALKICLDLPEAACRVPLLLSDLASAFGFRYAKLGEVNDYSLARLCAQEALHCFPQNPRFGDWRRSVALQNLGDVYLRCHWRTSGVEDLENAARTYKMCEEESESDSMLSFYGSTQTAYCLSEKGYQINWRYAQEGKEKAQKLIETGFRLSPIDEMNLNIVTCHATGHLLPTLETLYEKIQCIEDGIAAGERAKTRKTSAVRFVYVYQALAMCYARKAWVGVQPENYVIAVENFRQVTELLDADQWKNHLRIKINFALILHRAAVHINIGSPQSQAYGKEALLHLDPIIDDCTLAPWVRLSACECASKIAFQIFSDLKQSAARLVRAYDLIPLVLHNNISRPDQLRILNKMFDIPAYTLIVSLLQGKTAKESLELFDYGRNIFWDQNMRVDSSLPNALAKIGKGSTVYQLLRRGSIGSTSQPLPEDSKASENTSSEDQALRQAISADVDGLEGPIVVISIDGMRSDALILTNKSVKQLALPKLTLSDCWWYHNRFVRAKGSGEEKAEDTHVVLKEMAEWLWKTAAEPIMAELNFNDHIERQSRPRRIWWVTTKWIGRLPVHAAGLHEEALTSGRPLSVVDRVISSYVPTVKALQFARSIKSARQSIAWKDALLVAMPHTDGRKDLPESKNEVDSISTILSPLIHATVKICPKAVEIHDSLQACSIAHFACHAQIDFKDPARSRLLLNDEQKGCKHHLDVDTLLSMRLRECQMVYLSACNTAADWRVSEQSAHLAVAFLMSSVPHVIATVWKVADDVAREVAEKFYWCIAETSSLDKVHQAAMILRNVAQELRMRGSAILDWAAYVHYGA